MTKRCRHCLLRWPLLFFAVAYRSKSGVVHRRPECKFCRSDRRAELDAGAARRRPWALGACRVAEAEVA